MMAYKLVLDEPWTFLNPRGNPVQGRRLTFELEDGTMVHLDVSKRDYHVATLVQERLALEIAAHEALTGLVG